MRKSESRSAPHHEDSGGSHEEEYDREAGRSPELYPHLCKAIGVRSPGHISLSSGPVWPTAK